jgi:hypothetical protein
MARLTAEADDRVGDELRETLSCMTNNETDAVYSEQIT